MSYKTVDTFMEWVHTEKQNAKIKVAKEDFEPLTTTAALSLFNSSVNTTLIEDVITNQIVEYLDDYEPIEICYLQAFLQTVESVNFYKGSMKKTLNNSKSKTLSDKIDELKQTAQSLSYHTTEPITIRLPEDPIVSIYRMKKYLKDHYYASDDTINIFEEYLLNSIDKKNRQRISQAYKNKEDEINQIEIHNLIHKDKKSLSEILYFTTK